MARSGPCRVEQGVHGSPRPHLGGRVGEQPVPVVVGEHHPVEIGGELLRVHVLAELAFPDAAVDHAGDRPAQLVVQLAEAVADRSGLLIELGARLDEEAAARLTGPAALDPGIGQRPDPLLPTGHRQRGHDHRRRELLGGGVEDRELQGLLRAEVRVHPALRQTGIRGEAADRQPPETHPAREGDAARENRLAGPAALAGSEVVPRGGGAFGGHPGENSTIVRFRGSLHPTTAGVTARWR